MQLFIFLISGTVFLALTLILAKKGNQKFIILAPVVLFVMGVGSILLNKMSAEGWLLGSMFLVQTTYFAYLVKNMES